MDLSKISRPCTLSDAVACVLLVTIVSGVSMPTSVRVLKGNRVETASQAPIAHAAIAETTHLAERPARTAALPADFNGVHNDSAVSHQSANQKDHSKSRATQPAQSIEHD
jgi:hypothetical protein